MNATAAERAPLHPLADSGVTLLWVALISIVLDQITKHLILMNFGHDDAIAVLPFLEIIRRHNPGAAWNFLADAGGWQRWAFSVLGIGVSIGFAVWLRWINRRTNFTLALGVALIIGGAIGNVIDRLRLGEVTDFVHVFGWGYSFPAFNVADACISIGAACVILDALLEERRNRRAAAAQKLQGRDQSGG
jgi:signal peptidase II